MFDRNARPLGAAAGAMAAVLCLLAGGAGAAEPIKIGTFLAVTGPASFLGDPELKTLQMYIERINQEGGVLGCARQRPDLVVILFMWWLGA